MKAYVITTRAFYNGNYFDRLEETVIKTTKEEAEKEYYKQQSGLCDWLWDGGPYERGEVGEYTFVGYYYDGSCRGVVTMREVEV